MTVPRVLRWVSRLLPARWKDSVIRDVLEESAGRRGPAWMARQVVGIAVRLNVRSLSEAVSSRQGTLTGFSRDVLAAGRQLRRSPGSTLVAVTTLSLTVAAVVTVAAILHRTVLAPLPFADTDRLVAIWRVDPASPNNWLVTAPGDFVDWDREARSFATLAAGRNVSLAYTATEVGGAPLMRRVTHDWFDTIGIAPALGRDFRPEDDVHHGPKVALLSHTTWQNRFGGRADVVGDSVELDGENYTIIGVLPSSYHNPLFGQIDQAEIYLPLGLAATGEPRGTANLTTIGRLADGVTLEEARAEIDHIAEAQAVAHPETNQRLRATTQPIDEQLVRVVRTPLTVLLVCVLGLFIAACGNVANLSLARTLSRRHEHAVQQALGASRLRLLLQAFAESGLVAILSGGAAIALSAVAGPAVQRLTPPGFLAPTINFDLGPATLVIAGVVTFVAALITSVPSMLAASRRLSGTSLNAGVVRAVGSRERRRWAAGLIGIELAVATVLLACAGLAASGFRTLQARPLGFDPDGALTFRVSTRGPEFLLAESRVQFFERVLEELRALPGVTSAAGMNALPIFNQFGDRAAYRADLADIPAPGREPRVTVIPVTDGFFDAMGIRRLEGRDFNPQDRGDAPAVAILSRSAAVRLFGVDAAFGRAVAIVTGSRTQRLNVVGIADDVRASGDPTTFTAVAYVPMLQASAPTAFGFVVRSRETTASLIRQAEAAVHRVNRAMPLFVPRPLADVAASLSATARFTSTLMLVFAGLGLALVASGLYGTISHLVHDRRKEVGVRLALGASRAGVLGLVLRDGLRPAAAGMAVGLAGAVLAGRLMAGLVAGTPAFLWPLFLSLPMALLLVSVVSSIIPALQVTTVDPTTALKED